MKTVRAAAQHDGVAALEAERARIRRDVRPALIDDADDAERRRHALDDQAVRPREGRKHAPDRIRQGGDLFEAARGSLDAIRVERQPVDQGRAEALRLGVGEVAGVGGQNLRRSRAQRSCGGGKRLVLLLRRRIGEHARREARLGADRAHRRADFGLGLDDLDGGGHEAPNPRRHCEEP